MATSLALSPVAMVMAPPWGMAWAAFMNDIDEGLLNMNLVDRERREAFLLSTVRRHLLEPRQMVLHEKYCIVNDLVGGDALLLRPFHACEFEELGKNSRESPRLGLDEFRVPLSVSGSVGCSILLAKPSMAMRGFLISWAMEKAISPRDESLFARTSSVRSP